MVWPIVVRLALAALFGSAEIGLAQPKSPRQIAREAFPSVVLLVMQDSNGEPTLLGSGFVLRDGLVATNYHVISGGTSGYCRLVGKSVAYAIAGTTAVDVEHDLSLVAVTGLKAPALPIGDSAEVAVGDTVYAVGSPEGLEGTFSQGIVSAIRLVGNHAMLQVTAPISPGSSGGPILDAGGRVVGIATATVKEGQNLNLAIPSSDLTALLDRAPGDVAPLSLLRHAAERATDRAPPHKLSLRMPKLGTELRNVSCHCPPIWPPKPDCREPRRLNANPSVILPPRSHKAQTRSEGGISFITPCRRLRK
jgi:S1-C subfamily serine protease